MYFMMHFKNKTISFLFNKLKILIVEKSVVRMFGDRQMDGRTLVKGGNLRWSCFPES